MRTYITEDYQAMSRRAAHIIAAQVHLNPACVLGLATGSTPIGMYKQLIEWYKAGDLDFSQVKSVNLDEYAGLAPTHDQSYRYFMQTNLFDHINIDPANTNVPNGLAADPAAECRRYNQVIRDLGGIDVQVLGMGHNGHIGFNEPGDAFELETHVVDLQESTINANARFFASRDDVPRQAMTCHPPCSRLHPPDAPQRCPGGRQGGHEQAVIDFFFFQRKRSKKNCSFFSREKGTEKEL